MTSALQIKNLSKTYKGGQFPAVADASLTVLPGTILGLIGESGCGKTTILRMIAGFESPDTGTINIGDVEVVSGKKYLEPAKRNIGMIFQDFALFPHLNVLNNILFGVKVKSNNERRAIADKMLQLSNLTGLEKRFPRELSGGQQQRLALARCLATTPQLILLDEPFSNLDVSLKQQLRSQVGKLLKTSQTAAVLVTHDIEDTVALCDEIAIMKQGKIIQKGTFSELYQKPVNEYVARLTGELIELTNLINQVEVNQHTPKTNTFIRPHHLKMVEKQGKITAKVLNCKFIGKNYDYLMKSDNFEFTFSSSIQLEVDAIINLDFDTNELLQF